MPTSAEIEHRVHQADTARSAQRSLAAQQVGELAQRRAVIVEQLANVERQLGDVLTAAQDVIGLDELARFTDVPAADLTRWLDAHTDPKPTRKRKRSLKPADHRRGTSSETHSPESDAKSATSPETAPRAPADVS